MSNRFHKVRSSKVNCAFTLVELLVSIAVLTVLILLVTRLLNSAVAVTTTGNKHMDTDAQSRPLLDRMAIDFGRMVKRSDVDFFAKGTVAPNSVGGTMPGNDQIAFYSEVSGYSTGAPGPVSLVGYRVNSDSASNRYWRVERLGKGLLWNGASTTYAPVVFLPLTFAATWSTATSSNTDDVDYELIGPQVFRLEYYYLLKGQTVGGASYLSLLSDTPWDTRIAGHTSVNGLQDVAAIAVTIAVIDPKSRVLVSDAQLGGLAAPAQMSDFSTTMHLPGNTATQPGDLEAQWQSAINASAIPRVASSALHVYNRYFYLSPTK